MAEAESRLLRVFATKAFQRFAAKFGADAAMLWAVGEDEPDANLGGGVFKYRLARKGEGARGGARVIVAMRAGDRLVMMYGFEKKDLGNVSKKDLEGLRKAAKVYLALAWSELDVAVKDGNLFEVHKPSA